MLGNGNTHCFIVFLPPTARLYENKRLGTLDLARVYALALTVFGCEVVRSTIKVFECGEYFREVALSRFEHWEDVFE